jgi:biotin transporter BioY
VSYPFVAALAGFIYERGRSTFARAAVAGFAAEVLLFASGLTWLAMWAHSLAQAFRFGLYWFLSAEVIKILFAAAFAARFRRMVKG